MTTPALVPFLMEFAMDLARMRFLAIGIVVLLVAAGADARDKPKAAKRERAPRKAAEKAPDRTRCEDSLPSDPDLVAGFAAHAKADWPLAAKHLHAWATRPGAEADPAAARGFYSLSHAMRARGQAGRAAEFARKARDILVARAETAPSLEAYYYLASAHAALGDTSAQLEVVSRALRDIDGGLLCPSPDGDDVFRMARLAGAAGHRDREMDLMEKASALYAGGRGEMVAYRALAVRAMADRARDAGDLAGAQVHYEVAALMDPSIPDVHRDLGLVLIRQGKVREAAQYWGKNWSKERNDGNALMYSVPLLGAVTVFRERFGEQHVVDTKPFTGPALEQNAISEGKKVLELRAAIARAAASGLAPDPAQADALAVAEYRTHQFLLEMLLRGADLPAFALQNGLLPGIHGVTM